MRGNSTAFGSGKSGMMSGSADDTPYPTAQPRRGAAGLHEPGDPMSADQPTAGRHTVELQPECPNARPGADALDPRLHIAESRLELHAEPSDHHDTGREGRVGERELLADEVLLAAEPIEACCVLADAHGWPTASVASRQPSR